MAQILEAAARDRSVGPDVRVVVAVERGTPSTFRAEPQVVRELLGNLLANAVLHSPPGETVSLVAGAEGDYIRFDVVDRGPGIPAEEQARIFEQFYRTRDSLDRGMPGTGLGLWLTRRLAELLGGSVGVTSRPGHGSTFWLALPLHAPTSRSHAG